MNCKHKNIMIMPDICVAESRIVADGLEINNPSFCDVWKSDSNYAVIEIDFQKPKSINLISLWLSNVSDKAIWRIRGANIKSHVTNPFPLNCVTHCSALPNIDVASPAGYIDTTSINGTGTNLDLCNAVTDPYSAYLAQYQPLPVAIANDASIATPAGYVDVASVNSSSYTELDDTNCYIQNAVSAPSSSYCYDSDVDYYDSGNMVIESVACNQRIMLTHIIERIENLKLRFWQIDIIDPESDAICVSKIAMGKAFQPECNFSYGYGLKWVDEASSYRALGGKSYISCSNRWREFRGNLEVLDENEAMQLFNYDRLYGRRGEYVVIMNPANIRQDNAFLASIKEMGEISQDKTKSFSKPFVFEEII